MVDYIIDYISLYINKALQYFYLKYIYIMKAIINKYKD